MPRTNLNSTLVQPFSPVKSKAIIDTSHSPDSMIHHKPPASPHRKLLVTYDTLGSKRYGVSQSRRILPPGVLLKRFDQVRDCLQYVLALTTAQREVTLRLLRLYAYYGHVYPKESQITEDPGCSKATFWRSLRLLEELGLVEIINRYVMRPHAQISNLYRLDQLVLVLARYLAERGRLESPDWLIPVLTMPPRSFWSFLSRGPGDRAGPGIPAFEDLLSSRVAA